MKKLLIILFVLGISVQSFGQTVITSYSEDFSADPFGDEAFWKNDWSGGKIVGSIDNTNKIFQYVSTDDGNYYTGIVLDFLNAKNNYIDITGNKYVSLMAKADPSCTIDGNSVASVPFGMDLIGPVNDNIKGFYTYADVPTDGAWHQIILDFSSLDGATSAIDSVSKIRIHPGKHRNDGWVTYNGTMWIDNFNVGLTAAPVELTSFTAKVVDNNVVLNWETATEVKNYGFDIEASNDKENWSTIGFVNGHGNSNSPNSYSFIALDNSKYYRLKQLDTDGSFEYSNIVEIQSNLAYKLNQNTPNPFNPSTTVSFTLPKATHANISVYNMLGQKVMEVVSQEFSAGNHSININASQLSSGIYFYRLETSDFSKTKKMMLLK